MNRVKEQAVLNNDGKPPQSSFAMIRVACYPTIVSGKIKRLDELASIVQAAKAEGKKSVFTNGCFDLLHRGHIYLLREARRLGDLLVVALNTDRSIRLLKGPERPVVPENERAELIAALEMVDYVILFDQLDPCDLIERLKPDVLVKGGDWPQDQIVGRDLVEQNGGTVFVIPYLEGHSTSKLIERMRRN